MPLSGQIRTLLISAAILIMGIIHLGVGIGIVAKYRRFDDIFEQQVSLSGYNIFIALCAIAVSIIGFIAVLRDNPALIKFVAIASLLLGIITLASLIAALAITGQGVSHIRDAINDNMNDYVSDRDAIDVINDIQTRYECCGINVWLDWSRVQLNPGNGIGNGRRRRNVSPPRSPLVRALRRKRQNYNVPGSPIYNLPSSYSIYLPLSCCTDGGTSNGNSLGGYCMFSSANDSSSFYVGGCLEPITSIAFAQIGGLIVINTCLTILAFVYFGKLVTIFVQDTKAIEEQNKELAQNPAYQYQPQEAPYAYNGNYVNNYGPASSYGNIQSDYGYYL